MNQSLRIKVCGITHQSNLDTCMGMGAQFCGFIFHSRSSRYISPNRAAGLQSAHLKRVGVFVKQDEQEIKRIMDIARLDFAQLHGPQSIACAKGIGADKIIRVLWPQQYASVRELQADMERHADSCSWFLLDAGSHGGGSGKPLDWNALNTLQSPRPWFLAGGLSSASLAQALTSCKPDGVDLNSGVEWAPGHKSASSILSAMRAIDPYRHRQLTPITTHE